MIRRGFWLAAGAAGGIYGYRRVSAIGRRLSASLNPARPSVSLAQGASLVPGARLTHEATLAPGARLVRRGAIGLARETFRFTRDVREGMELYTARHSATAGSTLGARDLDRGAERDLQSDPERAPRSRVGDTSHDPNNHDPRPKDGH